MRRHADSAVLSMSCNIAPLIAVTTTYIAVALTAVAQVFILQTCVHVKIVVFFNSRLTRHSTYVPRNAVQRFVKRSNARIIEFHGLPLESTGYESEPR